ncbi:MAG: SUMF1/EgtB/PvdO family nonheme iron enzyme [Pseudohongiella sp.]|nr:SUMF1/EgtB/PvdO family nonheme iron enzyme [Pseudohongiella sp.]
MTKRLLLLRVKLVRAVIVRSLASLLVSLAILSQGSYSHSVYAQATVEIILPEMVSLPGGCFEMGTLLMDSRGNTPREICLDAFAISAREVTIGEFKGFLRSTGLPATSPALEILAHELPVVNVTWFDAMAYAQWLSKFTGDQYSLPSEEQWEYAAQAGNGPGTQFSWGNQAGINQANCRDCGSQWANITVAPVGSFPANAFGLHDMHGNAAEWTLGCFHEQDERVERRVNGERLSICRNATVRGGSFRTSANRSRVWQRAGHDSTTGADDIGFRVVRLSHD